MGKEMDVVISSRDKGKFSKKVKVEVPCLDGDMIGNSDWTKLGGGQGDLMKIQEFFKKVEDGLKGYLNLLFGCDINYAISKASSERWARWDKIGIEHREIASIVGTIRNKPKGLAMINGINSSAGSSETKSYLNLFNGVYGRNANEKVPIENLALEMWIYDRKEFENSYKDIIQTSVRRALVESIIWIILNGEWCTQKDFRKQKCLNYKEYKDETIKGLVNKDRAMSLGKKFQFDGLIGVEWHPGNGKGGRPKWLWESFTKIKGDKDKEWENIKNLIKKLGESSWHKKIQDEVAKEIAYQVFCNLIGFERRMIMEEIRSSYFDKKIREKICTFGKNGIICPKGGLIWKDKN
ncbi:hypothetical protein [Mycoplasma parvum]|uniref:Uncharacterized protein n=1 Tax=Mycoplasma parvum str. Indiana TaxID=1403316 RepID=U5NC38_9MOLU|nr:hypothetical protein [Mycoplasma parvum]AGX89141.1 hypothetical protein PRV_02015 [Mycoplasma parvum str. Indiana]